MVNVEYWLEVARDLSIFLCGATMFYWIPTLLGKVLPQPTLIMFWVILFLFGLGFWFISHRYPNIYRVLLKARSRPQVFNPFTGELMPEYRKKESPDE